MIQTAILILSGLALWLSTSAKPPRAGYVIGTSRLTAGLGGF